MSIVSSDRFRSTDEGKVLHVKAGHPMIEVVNEWHYGASHGTEPVELIALYVGVRGIPITIRDLKLVRCPQMQVRLGPRSYPRHFTLITRTAPCLCQLP